MPRNFLRGLLICLLPCLLAGFFAARLDKYRLGIDLAGGTILVYEVNLERTRQLSAARQGQSDGQPPPAGEGLSNEDMSKLAAQIKRRIDPADLKNVTVRPLGNTRVEIILPTGGSGGGRDNLTAEEIEEVKRLVSQMGVLEFRILANTADDAAGVEAAKALLNAATQEQLDAAARAGLPPPAPAAGEFKVTAAGDKAVDCRYAWVELGAEERDRMGLSNKYETQPPGPNRSWMYPTAAKAREPGSTDRTFTDRYLNKENTRESTAVYTSRPVLSTAQLAKEEADLKRLTAEGRADEFNPKKVEYFVLTRVSPADNLRVEGEVSLSARADVDQSFNPSVSFTFNSAGGQAFGRMTERNKQAGNTIRVLAILLDERVVSAPTLNQAISSQGQISGNFDKKSVDRLVNFLRNGALNAQLREKPVSENTIGPTLGQDTIKKGTMAVGLAFAAVLVFMVFYYRVAGLVACVALLANLLLTVGFMVAVNAAFTLPGLAGVVLMLGMAVDANVLIYERLREERNKGANLPTALRNGYDRAFLTIIDTHLTSIFTAVVLYTFGNDQLKGFAISLTVGLVISLFTSLYMTRLIFDYLLHRRVLTELRMMRLFERPNLNPMKYRFVFFPITAALTLVGLGLYVVRGDDVLNVDFRGGTVYTGRLKEGQERAMTAADGKPGLRDLLGEPAQRDRLKVKEARFVRPAGGEAGSAAAGTYTFEVEYQDGMTRRVTLTERPPGATEGEMQAAVAEMARHLPDVSVEQVFLSTDPDELKRSGKSRIFTVRTTERQRELVQLALDRLFRDGTGEPLMAQTKLAVGPLVGSKVELTFDQPTSPTYVKDLLRREFEAAGAVEAADEPFILRGVGPESDGRYTTMELDVGKNARLGRLADPSRVLPVGAVVGAAAVTDGQADGQAATLAKVLADTRAAFEGRPVPERLEVFDSTLAAETRIKAFYAILASWAAILLYLWFRFGNWTFGLAAVLCLVHDLCFTLGAIAVCHYLFDNPFGRLVLLEDFKIDLAAVAALLTLVGYSVNEIIVNFARIREVRGKNPALTPRMINDSVNQTLSRTILTSMTVFLVSIVLYVFGGEGVHLFAFVMVMGVLISTYSSVFVASPLLLFLGEGRHAAHEQAVAEAEKAEKTEEEYIEG